jgi:hypothetical protein
MCRPAVPSANNAWTVQLPRRVVSEGRKNNIQAMGFGFDLDQGWLPYAASSISSQPVKASRNLFRQVGDLIGYHRIRPGLQQHLKRVMPRLVLAEQLGGGAPPRLTLIIDLAQRLPIGVTHDETVWRDFSSPRWREAPRGSRLGFIELATLRQ